MIFPDVQQATGHYGSLLQVLQRTTALTDIKGHKATRIPVWLHNIFTYNLIDQNNQAVE